MEDSGNEMLHFSKEQLMPQEEVLESTAPRKKLSIGIPMERIKNESRIPLTPEGILLLTENGHQVVVENNAGMNANFSNQEYADSGAMIVDTPTEVYQSDIILKIAPPTLEETELLTRNQTLFSSVNLLGQSKDFFEKLSQKRLLAIGYEYIQDKTGALPVVKSMSEIVGTTSIVIAAEYLSNRLFGNGVILGGFPGIKPTEIVIIGAGTVAEYAAKAALGMGATVKVFDNLIYKLRTLQKNLGVRIYTSVLQPVVLEEALLNADVVIAAKHSSRGISDCLISADTVKKMKQGSVIVDVSIDQGGCFETSRPTHHNDPVFIEHGITHYCVPNIASRVPHTASVSLNNFLTPLLLNIGEAGGLTQYIKQDDAFSKGVYIFNGTLTSKQIGEHFDLRYRDLDLLLAAFR
ncbi:MAG: alanine dehydrogenase [Bacteroidetes bacterium]|nr:MAG: alanine dehydrogenase [Bacteroidota bacterium]